MNRAALTAAVFAFLIVGVIARGETTRTEVGGLEKRVVRIEGRTNCAQIEPLGGGIVRLAPVPCPPQLKQKGVDAGSGKQSPSGQPGPAPSGGGAPGNGSNGGTRIDVPLPGGGGASVTVPCLPSAIIPC